MYLLAFLVSWVSGWLLTHVESIPLRKFFSTLMGVLIQAYMYGIGNYLFILNIAKDSYRASYM